jgi:hypothetical protein
MIAEEVRRPTARATPSHPGAITFAWSIERRLDGTFGLRPPPIRGFTIAAPAGILLSMSRMRDVFTFALGKRPIRVVAPVAGPALPPEPLPDEVRADVELTIPRTRLDGFTAALVGEHGLGVGPVSPDRLTAAFAGAIDRAGGSGSASVSRSPAGVYTPEYWRFRIEAADAIAQGVLARAGKVGRLA